MTAPPADGDHPVPPSEPTASGEATTLFSRLAEATGLDEAELRKLDDSAAGSGQTIDRALAGRGIDDHLFLPAFAEHFELAFRERLAGMQAPLEFVEKVPVQFARAHSMIALGRDAAGLWEVATPYPLDVHPQDDLVDLLGEQVVFVLGPRTEVTDLINRAYRHKADGVDEALDDLGSRDIAGLAASVDEGDDLLDVANKAPVIKLVNSVLFQALKLRASDVHFQPFSDRLQVRFRIDGVLYDMEAVPKNAQDAVLSRIKVMAKMDIAERRMPQDGRASIRLGDGEVDVRISVIPTSDGERAVLRLLDKTARLYTMEEIGLDEENQKTLEHYIHYAHGIILVTGPTGSGKTTTLYGSLSRISTGDKNILTIEDPIEYHLDGISQIQVNTKKGLTFAAGLRSFLRQDPDVMMVGEIRDLETAEIAIRAALTGHLVFSTVHTNDAPSTITRLVDLGLEPYLVSSSILLVVAQRLVRVICPNCRTFAEPNAALLGELQALGLTPDQLPDGKVALGAGCDDCFHSGYQGRTAIYEMMPVSEEVRREVMHSKSATEMKASAIERGMRTLRMDGVSRVLAGVTTPAEVLRVSQLDIV